jgi:hypothetical protein
MVNGNMNDGGNFIEILAIYNLYFTTFFLISMITFLRLMPLGHTSWHFPQSIHF